MHVWQVVQVVAEQIAWTSATAASRPDPVWKAWKRICAFAQLFGFARYSVTQALQWASVQWARTWAWWSSDSMHVWQVVQVVAEQIAWTSATAASRPDPVWKAWKRVCA